MLEVFKLCIFSALEIADQHQYFKLMRKYFLISILCTLTTAAFSQTHVDTVHGYQIQVPNWWTIRETPAYMFGGTLPAVDDIENALIFKCFSKEDIKDMAEFESWVITGYTMGQSPRWSSQHKFLLRKKLEDFKEIGSAYKVQMMKGNKIFDCCYIMIETSKAYIWIDFTATSTTYPVNWDKFKEIVSSFKKL